MTPAFIAGDWGTTRARFWLCGADGVAMEMRHAPGIAQIAGGTAAVQAAFHAVVAGWDAALPAFLCGMVGSTIGWINAGYRDCPCPIADIGRQAMSFEVHGRTVTILPGLRTRNAFGLPDVMRGEETQIAGAFDLVGDQSFIAALPGTHNKWAVVEDGVVTSFHTALTGELFEAVARHTVLLGGAPAPVTAGDAFDAGVAAIRDNPGGGIESMIFSVRALQLAEALPTNEAASYLSGLIIGADVRSADAALGLSSVGRPIRIICSEHLATLYARALACFGYQGSSLSGADTVLAGLNAAYRGSARR